MYQNVDAKDPLPRYPGKPRNHQAASGDSLAPAPPIANVQERQRQALSDRSNPARTSSECPSSVDQYRQKRKLEEMRMPPPPPKKPKSVESKRMHLQNAFDASVKSFDFADGDFHDWRKARTHFENCRQAMKDTLTNNKILRQTIDRMKRDMVEKDKRIEELVECLGIKTNMYLEVRELLMEQVNGPDVVAESK